MKFMAQAAQWCSLRTLLVKILNMVSEQKTNQNLILSPSPHLSVRQSHYIAQSGLEFMVLLSGSQELSSQELPGSFLYFCIVEMKLGSPLQISSECFLMKRIKWIFHGRKCENMNKSHSFSLNQSDFVALCQ